MPDAPDYTKCVARSRRPPKPAKGQPKAHERAAQGPVQAGVRGPARPGHAAADPERVGRGRGRQQDVKVTDAEVKKAFDAQKKQSFPKEADYEKFLENSGFTEEDILVPGPRPAALQQAAREDRQGQGQGLRRPGQDLLRQEQAALRAARAPRPARRPDQDRGEGRRGQEGARGRRLVEVGGQEVLDRPGLEEPGRPAARRLARRSRSRRSTRPSSTPRRASSRARSRRSSATTSSRSSPPKATQQTLEQSKATIKQVLVRRTSRRRSRPSSRTSRRSGTSGPSAARAT